MADCPITIGAGNPAITLTSEGWQTFQGFAMQAFGLATGAIGNLNNFSVSTTGISAPPIISPVFGTFSAPPAPDAPDLSEANFSDPGAAPVVDIAAPETEEFPTFSGTAPPITTGPEPRLRATHPGAAPTLVDPTFPDDLDIDIGPSPDLFAVTIPDPLVLPTLSFTGEPPDASSIPFPVETWSYAYEDYTSALLEQVRSRISTMLLGEIGLPLATVTALRARAYADVDREELRNVQQATVEYAARGYDEPSGILFERVRETRAEMRDKRSALNRDIYIRDQEVTIENLRFAVQQGIAFEAQTIALHMKSQELILDAAKFARDSAIAILNAHIAVFNAQVQAYMGEAQVFRDLVAAQMTQVEIYKGQIEAQKLIGDVNRNLLAAYELEIRAQMAQVEIYTAQVNAARAWADVNMARIEGYRAEVQAYAALVGAYEAEWGGFRAKVEVEVAKMKGFELSVQAYAANVQAVASKNNVKIAGTQAEIGIAETQIRAYIANLEHLKTQIQADGERWRSQAAVYQGQASIYAAGGSIAGAQAAAGNQAAQIAVAASEAQAQTAVAQAQIIVTEAIQRAGLLLEATKGAASASAQLAGASMSAVNFGAQVGYNANFSDSSGCTTSYNYSGEID